MSIILKPTKPLRTISKYVFIIILYALAIGLVCKITWWIAGHRSIF
jgi:hypothetical protein